MCKAIENSSDEAKAKYLAGMAKSIPHKLELILPWLQGLTVVDLGCADGKFAADLALNRGFQVTGIDMSPSIIKLARDNHKVITNLNALDFKQAKAETFKMDKPVDNIILSSILHEVWSYGDWFQSVEDALVNAHKNLNEGGRIIIRDFVRPIENPPIILKHYKSDIVPGHAFDNLYPGYMALDKGDYILYFAHMKEAYEYIFHKDYHDNWETEIKETYGFWTMQKAREMVEAAGFKIIHTAEMDNEWITENRLKGKIELLTLEGRQKTPYPYPKYQMLLVAEKA